MERDRRPDVVTFLLLCTLEVCLAIAAVAMHKFGGLSWAEAWSRLPGKLGLLAAAAAVACAGYLAVLWRRRDTSGRRRMIFTAALQLFSLMVALLLGEVAVRVALERRYGESYVGGTRLLPRSWSGYSAARRSELVDLNARWRTRILVPDPHLGWSLGRSRASEDGLYASSSEGIRSPAPDVSYRALRGSKRVVAVVGDSFAFGLEVRDRESWARQLERRLGSDTIVLNFGVDGYGVDQAYLRYRRDVRPWKPDVVIFAFTRHDLDRTMAVYTFIAFPEWQFPFARPRMVVDGGRPRRLDPQVPSPDAIFSTPRVEDLPRLDYEAAYRRVDWRPRWYHASTLLRFVQSRFPNWQPGAYDPDRGEIEELNRAILADFERLAKADGSVPLLLPLPSTGGGDFPDVRRMDPPWTLWEFLERAGLAYLDVRGEVRAVPAGRRHEISHYSRETNGVVARSIAPRVRAILDER